MAKKDEEGEEKKTLPYPKSVFFIISTEFCERFSFYGMKSKLARKVDFVMSQTSKKIFSAQLCSALTLFLSRVYSPSSATFCPNNFGIFLIY